MKAQNMTHAFDPARVRRVAPAKPPPSNNSLSYPAALAVALLCLVAVAFAFFVAGLGWYGAEYVWIYIEDQLRDPLRCEDIKGILNGNL